MSRKGNPSSETARTTSFDLRPFEGRRARILVVDDETGPRESLRLILAPSYEVATANDASQALGLLRKRQFDLVTVDLNMPGMGGDELVSTIRDELRSVAVLIITGCGTFDSAVAGIRAGVSDYLTKPFDVVQVTAAVARALEERAGKQRLIHFLGGLGSVLGTDQEPDAVLRALETEPSLRDRLAQLMADDAPSAGPASPPRTLAFLEVLAEAIEQRDVLMLGHARRVASYAAQLAEAAGVPDHELASVRLAGFIHDIGKVAIPSDLLTAHERFDDYEYERVREHASTGERLLRPLGLPQAIVSAVRHHHERWDGNGYPDALAGESIPLAARIISVVDAFDAMTCERPYLPLRSEEGALSELRKHAGSQFDPTLVQVLAALAEHESSPLELTQRAVARPTIALGTGARG